jgi:peptidylprolyl isomerase
VPTRRTPVRLFPAALVLVATAALAGCGSNASSTPAASGGPQLGLDSVTVSGTPGTAPTVKFTGQVTDPTPSTKVLVKGTGPKVNQGDSMIVQTVIADGSSQKTVANSYADKQPAYVTLSKQVSTLFLNALEGQTIGSRVVVYTPADAVFGPQGNTQLGVAATDVVLIVFDLVNQVSDHPDGAKHAAPSWAPTIATKGGTITSFRFGKTPKPNGQLRSGVLRSGTGPTIKAGQTVFARYLGQVYGGKKPFDQNFDAAQPTPFQIGIGAVVAGWDKVLVGKHVGSEVVMAIPPKYGYGKQGSPQVGIKGTDTLYFVVEIVGAA